MLKQRVRDEALAQASRRRQPSTVHPATLQRKPMLAAVFRECHELMLNLDRRTFGYTPDLRIELGAGVAPIAGTFPDVLATDVSPDPAWMLCSMRRLLTWPTYY